MKHIIITLLLLLPFNIFANTTKSWSEGELKWDDFKGVTVIPGVPSFLKGILSITPDQSYVDGKSRISLEATAKVDCDRSFADSMQRTDQRLRYHQLQFDLLEVYRRRLQNDLNSGMTGLQSDERVKYYIGQYEDQIESIALQTKNGTDEHKLQEFEYYARKILDETSLPPVPEIFPNAFSYGFFIGTGAVIPLSDINKAFSGSWSFTAGLQVGWNRLKLKTDISYGQPEIKNKNIMGVVNQEAKSKYANYLAISVALGYTVYDGKYFSITPQIGGYWSSYAWNTANYEIENDEKVVKNIESLDMSNFNWYAGIDFDYHFHTSVSKSPFLFGGQREQYISSIRLTPFIGRAVFSKANPHINGCQIGFTVSYLGLGRSLGIK